MAGSWGRTLGYRDRSAPSTRSPIPVFRHTSGPREPARGVIHRICMAHYLVTAVPMAGRMEELGTLLRENAFATLHPFGGAITLSLRYARLREDGTAVWAEEDYCTPPLAQERSAVLDAFFGDLATEPVGKGEGWKRIHSLTPLFPDLADRYRGCRPGIPPGIGYRSRAIRSAVRRDCRTQSFNAIPR